MSIDFITESGLVYQHKFSFGADLVALSTQLWELWGLRANERRDGSPARGGAKAKTRQKAIM